MQNTPSDDFRGTETSYTYNPTLGAIQEITYQVGGSGAVANRRNHTINDNMLHNTMRWA
jgi:hypothetical protein